MGCLLISLQAFPQFQSTPLKNVTKSEEGIKYTYLKSMFEIQVETRRTTEIQVLMHFMPNGFWASRTVVLTEKTTWEQFALLSSLKPFLTRAKSM